MIVAPEALNRFYLDTSPRPHGPDAKIGATWMTREDRENEIRDYVRYLDQLTATIVRQNEGGKPPRLMLFGFSQGVATVCRWFTLGKTEPDAVVLWSGHVPFDLNVDVAADRWRSTPVFVVWGSEDAKVNAPGIERDRVRFESAGVSSSRLEFQGGHELDAPTLQQLAAVW